MQLLTGIAIIAAGALAVALFYALAKALNRQAQVHYGYSPITVRNALLATSAWIVVVVGLVMGGNNIVTGIIVAVVIILGLALWIASKSSALTALAAIPLLAIEGAGIVFVTLLLGLMFGQRDDKTASGANRT